MCRGLQTRKPHTNANFVFTRVFFIADHQGDFFENFRQRDEIPTGDQSPATGNREVDISTFFELLKLRQQSCEFLPERFAPTSWVLLTFPTVAASSNTKHLPSSAIWPKASKQRHTRPKGDFFDGIFIADPQRPVIPTQFCAIFDDAANSTARAFSLSTKPANLGDDNRNRHPTTLVTGPAGNCTTVSAIRGTSKTTKGHSTPISRSPDTAHSLLRSLVRTR